MKHIREIVKNALSNRKLIVWVVIIGLMVSFLVFFALKAYHILYTPQSLFNYATIDPSLLADQNATPEPTSASGGSGATAALSTVEPDITAGKDVLNIILIGIDTSDTVGKQSGNDPHADVMMVLSINFKEKKVDLISLPRDTFVHDPELMNGVYKLNASFNVGGGYAAKDGGGFLKVCQAAKYMLGGIPVDYYYAVDFTSLVGIVNTIGGVDYDVENRAYSREGISGLQHMNGDDVLFYVRTRKVGPEQGDVNRVNRQKKLLVAIFNQLMKNGKLSMVPDLLSAANNGIYTNTTLQQTLALANFAKSIGTNNIYMHSMAGEMADKASWHYCFTDQKARQELIKQIYGIDVPEQVHCSLKYADWVVGYGFSAIRYQKTAKQLLDAAAQQQAGFTSGQQAVYDTLTACYAKTQSDYDVASLTFRSSDNYTLATDKKELKAGTEELAKLLKYTGELKWTYNHSYWLDPAINEVLVDFR